MNIDKFGRHLIVGVTHQTSTNKFGRHISSADSPPLHQIGGAIPLTADGNYNIENKRLCNVHFPIDNRDCANKGYVDQQIRSSGGNFKLVTELAQLTMRTDKLEKEHNNHDREINDIHKTIHHIKTFMQQHEHELNKIVSLESRIQLKLDSVELNCRTSEQQLKKLLKSLETRVDTLEKSE